MITTEAIVLKRFAVKDNDTIITLFTPNHGLIKLYFKGQRRANYFTQALFSPLTCGEYVIRSTKGDFFSFKEGSVLEHNLELRNNLPSLKLSLSLLEAVIQSQWPDKPAEPLYKLLRTFLKQIPTSKNLKNLLPTFLLKTLIYEGAFAFEKTSHTLICRFENKIFFTEEEEHTLALLALARHFSVIESLEITKSLETKLSALFLEMATT